MSETNIDVRPQLELECPRCYQTFRILMEDVEPGRALSTMCKSCTEAIGPRSSARMIGCEGCGEMFHVDPKGIEAPTCPRCGGVNIIGALKPAEGQIGIGIDVDAVEEKMEIAEKLDLARTTLKEICRIYRRGGNRVAMHEMAKSALVLMGEISKEEEQPAREGQHQGVDNAEKERLD